MASLISNTNNTTIFSDIDPNFIKNPKTGDILLVRDERSIRQSLSNLLQTSFGERLFRPQIGGSLRNLLFEPIDGITTFEIKDRILSTINNHEPRVNNVFVDVVSDADKNEYKVSVEFSIVRTRITDNINLVLERIR